MYIYRVAATQRAHIYRAVAYLGARGEHVRHQQRECVQENVYDHEQTRPLVEYCVAILCGVCIEWQMLVMQVGWRLVIRGPVGKY